MVETGNNSAREKPLHDMFTAVPPRYDLINRIITLGMDERWRNRAARECLANAPKKVLDLCCGTADLAVRIARMSGPEVEIHGLDYSQPMLELAAAKTARTGLQRRITFRQGDASAMPYPDNSFDTTGIAFAFRNLTYRNPLADKHLAEILRTLAPGGRFVIVESSQPEFKPVRALDHFYLRWFVRPVGQALSGNRGAYSYLAESASRFYTPKELQKLLLDAGFRKVYYRALFFGAAGIHIAIK